mgnify:FL=1
MINFSIIVIMDAVCSAARNTGTEKRTLKTILIICLVLVTAAFAAGQVYSRVVTDTVPPVITLDSDSITVSVEDGRDALLRGVTASDAKDGDLTGQIIVSGVSKLISNNTAKVSYMVFDKAGNMASATRYVVYSDYHRPRFMLITPLVYSLGETVSITGRLQAQDAVDGDITSSIRVLSSDIISSTEGVYNLTLQVINSLGDTAQVTLPVTIRAEADGDSAVKLRRYLVYVGLGDNFEPRNYIESVSAGSVSDVRIDSNVDTQSAGCYLVTYTVTSGGRSSSALMTVVVE